jgi:hypothetical protein
MKFRLWTAAAVILALCLGYLIGSRTEIRAELIEFSGANSGASGVRKDAASEKIHGNGGDESDGSNEESDGDRKEADGGIKENNE